MKESTGKTQEQRREESVGRMIQAAVELIAARGIAALTMAEVGIKAGYSRGLAHQHFGSKEKLLSDCLNHLSEQFNLRRKENNPDTSGINGIYSMVDTYTERPAETLINIQALFVIVLDSSTSGSPLYDTVHKYNKKNMEYIEFKLMEALKIGQIKSEINIKSAAIILMSLLRGFSFHRLNDPHIDSHAIRDEILVVIRNWLVK